MTITLTLSAPQAAALRHVLLACLDLGQRSPVIADALDITPDDEQLARQVLDQVPDIPRRPYTGTRPKPRKPSNPQTLKPSNLQTRTSS